MISKSKYRAIRTNGYASKKEAARAEELKLLERAGRITVLREQVVYVLAPSYTREGRKVPALRYFADFVYTENGAEVVEDVKGGILTDAYKIKRHLMATVHGIWIHET